MKYFTPLKEENLTAVVPLLQVSLDEIKICMKFSTFFYITFLGFFF